MTSTKHAYIFDKSHLQISSFNKNNEILLVQSSHKITEYLKHKNLTLN